MVNPRSRERRMKANVVDAHRRIGDVGPDFAVALGEDLCAHSSEWSQC